MELFCYVEGCVVGECDILELGDGVGGYVVLEFDCDVGVVGDFFDVFFVV